MQFTGIVASLQGRHDGAAKVRSLTKNFIITYVRAAVATLIALAKPLLQLRPVGLLGAPNRSEEGQKNKEAPAPSGPRRRMDLRWKCHEAFAEWLPSHCNGIRGTEP